MGFRAHPVGMGTETHFVGYLRSYNYTPTKKPESAYAGSGFFIRWKGDLKGRHQSADWCKKVSAGQFSNLWENPFHSERIASGCGRNGILLVYGKSGRSAAGQCVTDAEPPALRALTNVSVAVTIEGRILSYMR